MKPFHKCAGGTVAAIAMTAMPMLASAGITLYEEGDKSLEIGGRLQPQYRYVDGDNEAGDDSGDDFFLRRLRFYIEGTVTENIYGIWQIDFGDQSDDPEVKDAFINYSGLPMGTITVGNHYVPFSREALTSSKRQQFVERTVVGDHNFGVPDREMGVSYNLNSSDQLQGSIGAYQAGIDPSFSKLDFESRVSSDAEYFGNMVAGRVDWTPLGAFKLAQGAFGEEMKFGLGANAFTWNNDDDVTLDDVDQQYDSVTGYGVDAAFRLGYFSVDAGVQYFDGDTRGDVTSTGLIDDSGDANFTTYLLKGGYMVVPTKLELVAGFSGLDTDDGFRSDGEVFDDMDKRYSIGANYFFNKHKAKIQMTYEIGRDVLYSNDANDQVPNPSNIGGDQNTLFIQFQQVI